MHPNFDIPEKKHPKTEVRQAFIQKSRLAKNMKTKIHLLSSITYNIKITMLVYCENSSNQINLWCRGVICPPVCLLMDYSSTTPAYRDLYWVDILG